MKIEYDKKQKWWFKKDMKDQDIYWNNNIIKILIKIEEMKNEVKKKCSLLKYENN